MLEYFKPQLFRKFAKLYDENNLLKELETIEGKGISQGEVLKEWENDEWVDIWLKSSPSLHSLNDLRHYFYLTRDALVNRVVSNANKLSPQALEILNSLKSGTDLQINNALKKADDISDHEANEILSSIFDDLLSDSSGDTNSFKAFIRWSTTKKSMYGEAFSLLRNIPQSKIKLSFIPLLEEFGKKTNQKAILRDWLNTMKFDGSISKAIEQWEK
jgi:hypothetical protein